MSRFALRSALALTCAAAALLAPAEARACGGTFCDAGPNAMPVDQTGENILFVMSGTSVEAHIQIQYDPTTEAEQFAWLVPLQQVPEFSVGSQPLFDAMLAATVPRYGWNPTFDTCGGDGDGDGDGDGGIRLDVGSDDTGGGEGGGEPPGPEVVFESTVGAFDIVVLQGGTAEEVMTWLGDNDYQQDPAAEPILAEYLAEGFLFAAFKLTNGADVGEIHPVVLEFDTMEACVPLRLTRIAASEDMEVRTFFMSQHRIVPRNYRHVLVNPLKIDWPNLASNYKEVVTLAVDALGADGRAFVTEYAGDNVIPTGGLWSGAWDASAFQMADPTTVVTSLQDQGLLWCENVMPGQGDSFCEFYHPLIEGLLDQFLPAPDSVPRHDFWSCLGCYEGLIDPMAWDSEAFSGALLERIIEPGAHAVDLIQTWSYLTRMYTTISPNEMIEDPFFYANPDLPPVPSLRIATQRNLCSADQVYILPDGREVFLPRGSNWPDFPDAMPWEEDVDAMLPAGSPESVVDNTALIDLLLAEYNRQYGWPGDSDSDGGSGSTGGDGDATDGLGTTGGTGDADTETGGSAGQDSTVVGSGCACDARGGQRTGWGLFALLGLGAAARRRRRR